MSKININISEIETRLFINNEFVNSVSGKTFDVTNPATEEITCSVQEADVADVDIAVKAAKDAFALGSPWRSMNGSARRDLLIKLADLIERDSVYLSNLESLDNGKPLGVGGYYGSVIDVSLTIKCYRYYAGWADKINGESIPIEGDMFCYSRKEPIGVCGCIIPWNFPMLMQAWKLAPALACGCTIVLKTSEKTPLSGLYISKLIKEAGFPPGVVNTLSGFGPTAGQAIARHPDVEKVAFTGSSAVGHKMLQYSAETNLKNVSLELGGKSPLIILDDADLNIAVQSAHIGLFLNQGQCCVASSRLFVQEGIYDKFVEAAVKKASEVAIGSYDQAVEQGPQVDKIQFDRVMGYIEKGKSEGAIVSHGGSRHGDKGYFVQPTVFSGVSDDMTIAKEEIFGPVMSILKFKTVEEVVERANNTMYGLGAGVISRDVAKAISIAHQIRAGTVWINTYDQFDIAAPFGGYKQSGHGRDKGKEALDNFLETKSVFIPIPGPKC